MLKYSRECSKMELFNILPFKLLNGTTWHFFSLLELRYCMHSESIGPYRWRTVLDISQTGHLWTLLSLRSRWIKCFSDVLEKETLVIVWVCESSRPPSGLHQNATAAIEEALALYLSLSLICQAAAANCHGNRSWCWGVSPVWWDVNYWPFL